MATRSCLYLVSLMRHESHAITSQQYISI